MSIFINPDEPWIGGGAFTTVSNRGAQRTGDARYSPSCRFPNSTADWLPDSVVIFPYTVQIGRAESVCEDGRVTKHRFGPLADIETYRCQLQVKDRIVLNPFVAMSGLTDSDWQLYQQMQYDGSVGYIPGHEHGYAVEWVREQEDFWVSTSGIVYLVDAMEPRYRDNVLGYLLRRWGHTTSAETPIIQGLRRAARNKKER